MAVALAIVGSGVAISLLHAQGGGNPPAWVVGDVFVAVGKGQYQIFSKASNYQQSSTVTSSIQQKKDVAGCWFDAQFNMYSADFYNTKIVKYNLTGSHASSVFADTNAQAPNGHTESVTMAANGDVYAGQAGDGTLSRQLLRYRSDGAFVASYTPAIESGGVGIDWIDLSTDQQTMFFTSKFHEVRKFDVVANTTTTFATLPSAGQAGAIRLLGPSFNGNHGALVANNVDIKRLDSGGNVVASYDYDPNGTNNDEDTWTTLNLDPDGVHFWAGGSAKGRLYRFPIGSPSQTPYAPDLGPISTSAGSGDLHGICVMGEPQTQVVPLNLSTGGGGTVLKDITAPFGNPASTGENDFNSFSTWRLRIHVKANQSIVAAVSFVPQTTDLTCTPANSDDFDCRFSAASQTAATQCVPFFRDPTATPAGSLDSYRCAFYRVKDMPTCLSTSPGSCPFDEGFVPDASKPNGLSNDLLSDIILNLTNPPSGVFNVTAYGPAPKGNPRIMRDPDSVNTGPLANQFFIDATTAVIDWPSFGTGTPNDYSPVQRLTTTSGEGGGCADIIKPDGTGQNGGSAIKVIVEAKKGPRVNGVCTGDPLEGATINGNNLTLAIAGTGSNTTLVIYCDTPGNSLGCFTPVNGQPGRYQSTVDLSNPPFVPDTVNPYFFAVTSVNVPTANPGTQNPGMFPPTGRSYFICPNGSNCGS